jgi:Protein of unknown function (DUF3105)
MGNTHDIGQPQRYAYCPPASGKHINSPPNGPIPARLYGPDDFAQPPGWVHNLEHGGLVVLYRCDGDACDDAGQARMRQFFQTFPNSPVCNIPRGQIGPVIARFDEMAWPYAAIVWDRVLPLQTFDAELILKFFNQYGERTNGEKQCQPPEPSASISAESPSPAATESPAASGPDSAEPSAATSASPS